MKFKKIRFFMVGRFTAGLAYSGISRRGMDGYTTEKYPEIVVHKGPGKCWYVSHIPTGLGIVTVGSPTREAAVEEYVKRFHETVSNIDPDRLKKMVEQFESAPLETVAAKWTRKEYVTTYDYRLDKFIQAAKTHNLIYEIDTKEAYLHGGKLIVIGDPRSFAELDRLVEHYAKHDTTPETEPETAFQAPAVIAPAEPEPAPEPEPEKELDIAAGPLYGTDGNEKHFIGTVITGRGWKIRFTVERTAVIFDRMPPVAYRNAVKAAGFKWAPAQKSWNKGATWKAYRAALQLAEQLKALAA